LKGSNKSSHNTNRWNSQPDDDENFFEDNGNLRQEMPSVKRKGSSSPYKEHNRNNSRARYVEGEVLTDSYFFDSRNPTQPGQSYEERFLTPQMKGRNEAEKRGSEANSLAVSGNKNQQPNRLSYKKNLEIDLQEEDDNLDNLDNHMSCSPTRAHYYRKGFKKGETHH